MKSEISQLDKAIVENRKNQFNIRHSHDGSKLHDHRHQINDGFKYEIKQVINGCGDMCDINKARDMSSTSCKTPDSNKALCHSDSNREKLLNWLRSTQLKREENNKQILQRWINKMNSCNNPSSRTKFNSLKSENSCPINEKITFYTTPSSFMGAPIVLFHNLYNSTTSLKSTSEFYSLKTKNNLHLTEDNPTLDNSADVKEIDQNDVEDLAEYIYKANINDGENLTDSNQTQNSELKHFNTEMNVSPCFPTGFNVFAYLSVPPFYYQHLVPYCFDAVNLQAFYHQQYSYQCNLSGIGCHLQQE